ncbi:MAG TPA: non-ribosomal peptide synthetase [Thermoanaerobaculia bacterium]|nr:non-ribosomal peptide synthetase [Thermoanaerobaculia bacterium]
MSSIPEFPRSRSAPGGEVRPPRAVARPATLRRAVEEQARRRPCATALADGDRRLTFGELDALANGFAAELGAAGAGAEAPVAIRIRRPIERTVAALAAWKTGAAYLPLDPETPESRVAFILRDAAVSVVVDDLDGSSPGPAAVRLALDRGRPAAAPPAPESDPFALAYVIYTSGSTGAPKGVEVEHRSLSNLAGWHRRTFRSGPADRASQLANPAFDAAIWELWPSLASGAAVHFPPAEVRRDPPRLRDWLVGEGITIAFAPTPLAERLLALSWPSAPPLRLLLTGGDVLHRRPPAGLPFGVVNNYGPTEATVVATSGVVALDGPGRGLPSIGRPIDGVEALVLADDGTPAPEDAAGELCLSGAALARGYVGGAARHPGGFAPHPFRPGERIYRTGDRVRRRPDGRFEFLGRIDGQVKVRGFRVETAEVEAALGSHPDVRSCLVRAAVEPDGETRLVAWLVGGAVDSSSLREFLRARLPEYMIPAAFVPLEAFPVTANGKVDRDALPPPPRETAEARSGRPPGSPVEERVAAIASGLLRMDRIGVDENFFALGGHSLLGTQMIARVRDAFGVELPLRTVFEAPTVARLAEEVEALVRRRIDAMSEEEAARLAGEIP